jgi:hypothetical protein
MRKVLGRLPSHVEMEVENGRTPLAGLLCTFEQREARVDSWGDERSADGGDELATGNHGRFTFRMTVSPRDRDEPRSVPHRSPRCLFWWLGLCVTDVSVSKL